MKKLVPLLVSLGTLALPSAANAIPTWPKPGQWAGYALVAKPHFTLGSAAAYFNVPTANCKATAKGEGGNGTWGNGTAIWAGLDGRSNATVEQAGVWLTCKGNTPTYRAFIEMYSAADNGAYRPPHFVYNVNPGDEVGAEADYTSPHRWFLYVEDHTTGAAFGQYFPGKRQNASAEAVVEHVSGRPYPTKYFGSVTMYTSFSAPRDVNSFDDVFVRITNSMRWTAYKVHYIDYFVGDLRINNSIHYGGLSSGTFSVTDSPPQPSAPAPAKLDARCRVFSAPNVYAGGPKGTVQYGVYVIRGVVTCPTATKILQGIANGKGKIVNGGFQYNSYTLYDGWICPAGQMGAQLCNRGSHLVNNPRTEILSLECGPEGAVGQGCPAKERGFH